MNIIYCLLEQIDKLLSNPLDIKGELEKIFVTITEDSQKPVNIM